VSLEVIPVWKQVTPELKQELVELWASGNVMTGDARQARADQAVCIARDEQGAVWGVATAVVRILPRLRQPMYFYRQFFAEGHRGQKQTVPFFNAAKAILQAYNQSLDQPESLGMLVELENQMLSQRYTEAYGRESDSTFIGYSPRGLQLRVSYFEGARLMPPAQLPRVARPARMARRA
jgi:hypothetical protein